MDLEALADFNLVAAQGGFSRAARFADRSKATLSRRVSELEQALGVRLIERGTHTLRLTEEGHALHSRTEGLLAELAEAGEAIALGASVPRGRLRVSSPIVFAHVALGRIGARFALAYPDVQLEIVADDRLVDPVEDGFDLVIRINPVSDEHLVGRNVLYDERLIVAAPSFTRLGSHEPGASEARVRAVVLSAITPSRTWRMRASDGSTQVLTPQPALRLSSLLMVRDAALAGAGVALLPKLLVADDVAAGSLVLWGVEDAPAVEIWALQSSRRLVGAKVRAFLDVLEQSFPGKAYRPLTLVGLTLNAEAGGDAPDSGTSRSAL